MPVKRGIARAATSDLTRIDECIRQMSSPSVDQVARQWGAEYVTRAERICAEAKEAYDARNPHKKAVAEIFLNWNFGRLSNSIFSKCSHNFLNNVFLFIRKGQYYYFPKAITPLNHTASKTVFAGIKKGFTVSVTPDFYVPHLNSFDQF